MNRSPQKVRMQQESIFYRNKKSLKEKEKSKTRMGKKEKKHLPKKSKKIGKPKRPPSAFLMFCSDKRAEMKDRKLSAKELGEIYITLEEAKKNLYLKKYEEAKKKYLKELADLEAKNSDIGEEQPKTDKNPHIKNMAKIPKSNQKKNNKKACNCGKCKECQKFKKKSAEEGDD